MFEGLRKKFSNFIGGLVNKEKEDIKEAEQRQQEAQKGPVEEEKEEAQAEEKPAPVKEEKAEQNTTEEKRTQPQQVAIQKSVEEKMPQPTKVKQPEKKPEPPKPVQQAQAPPEKKFVPPVGPVAVRPVQHGPATAHPMHEVRQSVMQPANTAKAPVQPKVSFTTKLKSIIFSQVRISEKDAGPFIESLKIELLQSDVNYDVADKIALSIRNNLVGKPVDSKNIEREITESIRASILQVLSSSPDTDIVRMVNEKKAAGQLPFKIMFIGPNGAGKTTTMAKIANLLLSNNISCVMSASDTFRAAAIEQTVVHAGRLGINVIKGSYGADPSSVAFDAIAHAKAHNIMVVLIDSAGRQETNKSLIEELKKMTRVTAPDLKIFVGEAISGNALLDQVKAIDSAVKIDGVILTKLDVDAKGGNTISILSDTAVPILFFGTGEKYTDIMRYDPKFIIDNILPSKTN